MKCSSVSLKRQKPTNHCLYQSFLADTDAFREISLSDLTYSQALSEANRQAFFSVLAALLITVFFWGGVYFTYDSLLAWWGLPLWFWLSCVIGYFFSIVVVYILVHYFFRPIDLNCAKEDTDQESHS